MVFSAMSSCLLFILARITKHVCTVGWIGFLPRMYFKRRAEGVPSFVRVEVLFVVETDDEDVAELIIIAGRLLVLVQSKDYTDDIQVSMFWDELAKMGSAELKRRQIRYSAKKQLQKKKLSKQKKRRARSSPMQIKP
eukprot:PhM_4_TR8172/c0_g1_i1/m.62770